MFKKITLALIILIPVLSNGQNGADSALLINRNFYLEKNGDTFICNKPRTFNFITNIPGDVSGYISQSFQKKNLYKVGIVAASTALLVIFDQKITNGVQRFGRRNGISENEDYDAIASIKLFGKKTVLGKWPDNINTEFYNLGQGSSVVYMAAAFYIGGTIQGDHRALQTASQLIESFLALGAGTQLMKYGTGRENPTDAGTPGGRWRPFPSFADFQNKKTKYDAFPSGHLATFVSAVTIISENYPTKKWIKPVGYTISGLLSMAMINNGVHWASDFPLGFAIGYGYGKYISRKNKVKVNVPW